MKKIISYTLALAVLLVLSTRANAQYQQRYYTDDLPEYPPAPVTFELRYSAGLPMDGLKQQVSNTSYNGWDASLMFPLGRHFHLGVALEYQDFYQKYPRADYYYGDQYTNISAVVSNSIQNIPILLKGTYALLGPNAFIQPYIGVGVGVNAVTYRQYLGEFTNYDQSSGKLAVNGEVGIKIPVSRNRRLGIDLAAEYNYLPYNQFGINNMDYIGLKGGIYVPL